MLKTTKIIKEIINEYINDTPNDRYSSCGFEMLIGIPGCGKSTYIRQIDNNNVVVVSPDNIRKELTGNISDQSKNADVFEIAEKRIIKNIFDGKYVILDATNVNTKYRKLLIDKIKSIVGNGVNIYATVFDCDPDVSKQRISKDIQNGVDRANVPNNIIDIMYSQYLDTINSIGTEAFDNVFFIDSK